MLVLNSNLIIQTTLNFKDSFIKMTNEAKIEVAKTLHDQKATALRSIHVPV